MSEVTWRHSPTSKM